MEASLLRKLGCTSCGMRGVFACEKTTRMSDIVRDFTGK